MDYEKKYNEALEHARAEILANPGLRKTWEEIFPELRESEWVMEDLIGGLMWQRDNLGAVGPHDNSLILPGFCLTVGEHLAYLEKQKELSTEHKTYDGKALSRSYDLGYRKGVADAEKEMYEESGYTPDESRAYDHGYENGYNDGKDEAQRGADGGLTMSSKR